jgi:uncharacterized flavoprotein (TIGR03862 family)
MPKAKEPVPKIAIIGGGPAGLMAAETLAALGHKVVVYERMASVGRKFLLAGRGGLNLTHSEALAPFLTRYGTAQNWMSEVIAGFSPDDLRAWAQGLGQELFVGSSGRVFPKAMKASPLLRAWLARLNQSGVSFVLGAKWLGWDDVGQLVFARGDGTTLTTMPAATVLALGGASWAKLGSDGAWVAPLQERGVTIAPLQASNCGVELEWSAHLADKFAGTPIKGVAITCGNITARGDVVITAKGLEGGALYALSPALRAGLKAGHCEISFDLRPDVDTTALAQKLVKSKAGQSLSSALKGQARLSPAAIGLMREASDNKLPTTAMRLATLMKAVTLTVTALAPIDKAISSAGGITKDAVTGDLMLTTMPGVFAAGEMLDWEAPTGGYLLQACFASGKQAATGVHNWLEAKSQD